ACLNAGEAAVQEKFAQFASRVEARQVAIRVEAQDLPRGHSLEESSAQKSSGEAIKSAKRAPVIDHEAELAARFENAVDLLKNPVCIRGVMYNAPGPYEIELAILEIHLLGVHAADIGRQSAQS